jgi:hypothetical protein
MKLLLLGFYTNGVKSLDSLVARALGAKIVYTKLL